jgi:hypothetical protein
MAFHKEEMSAFYVSRISHVTYSHLMRKRSLHVTSYFDLGARGNQIVMEAARKQGPRAAESKMRKILQRLQPVPYTKH